jgi:peptidoglycan/xylan/chitin deacetylase (PgdA/CDA1 family)
VKSLWINAARAYLSGPRGTVGRRDGIRVFYYHGLVERKADSLLERNFNLLSDFRSHIRLLRRFRMLGLSELAHELSAPRARFKTAAVVTFDDGFANNLLAAEIMAAARLPWCVFICTGVVGRDNSTWPEELALLLLHGEAGQVEALEGVWGLRSRNQRESAFEVIRVRLKAMPSALRRQTMDCIRQQFPNGETSRLLQKFPSMRMLSWKEVGQLAHAGAEVGSHGVEHEIHHINQPEATRRIELSQSKAELEKRLLRPCASFAFPNGDFTPSSPSEVRAAGYDLAFTTKEDTIKPAANPYLLPRLYPSGPFRRFTQDFFWVPAE